MYDHGVDGNALSQPTSPVTGQALTEPGRWATLFEELLRGIVHAMNNRITSLSSLLELAAMDDEAPEIDKLREEITRLHEVSVFVGVLASRSVEQEALEIHAVLEHAVRIHIHHPRTRTVACIVERGETALAVRVPRWALLRLLLLMVDAAKQAAGPALGTSVVVRVTGDDQNVRVHITSNEPLGRDAAELAAQCGGSLHTQGGEVQLQLPSLQELRRLGKLAR
ncbi:MAG: hypothetical protein ABI625_07815 [bacterium]